LSASQIAANHGRKKVFAVVAVVAVFAVFAVFAVDLKVFAVDIKVFIQIYIYTPSPSALVGTHMNESWHTYE